MNYLRLGITAVIAVLLAACAFLAHGWYAESQDFAEYRGQVKAIGQAQEERTRDRIALDKARKDTSDAQYAAASTAWVAALDRMRQQARTDTYVMPATGAVAGSADTACFDRGALDAALRAFADGTAGLVAEGEAVRLRLTTAVEWARTR